ncbi:hypothetical protein [Botrimarina sp.]|uniref:hypothetical protein n=1 Tax=Botrimarina sp. TaxID=2795802 RepID=UPI0032EF312D
MLLEKTQRRLCRALFLLGCVLPTLAVAGFVVDRWAPGYERELLATLGEALEARVECDRVLTPRPGVVELRGVRLTTPTTGKPLADCTSAIAARDGARWRLTLGEVRVPDAPIAARWLQQLVRTPLVVDGRCVSLELNGAAPIAKARFKLAGAAERSFTLAGQGATLSVAHAGGAWSARAATGPLAAPAAWLPGEPLGFAAARSAVFNGECRSDWSDAEPTLASTATGTARFDEVEVGGLSASTGSLRLDEFHWRGAQVVRLAGRLDLRDGKLSREVVYGMHTAMGCQLWDEMHRRYNDPNYEAGAPFSQFACEVELDASGLTVVAGCGEIDGRFRGDRLGHAIAEHDGEALLREPLTRPLPPHTLVRAWRPLDAAELPASRAAIHAASRLPDASTR